MIETIWHRTRMGRCNGRILGRVDSLWQRDCPDRKIDAQDR